MGREKERHSMQDEPSGRVCYCSNPIANQDLPHYYDKGECPRCTWLKEKDD